MGDRQPLYLTRGQWADNPPPLKYLITKPQREEAGLNYGNRPRKRLNDLRIGFWNILSLHRLGALRALLAEVDTYRIDIAAIQEVRWIGQGIMEKKYHTLYYSCHEKHHIFGTGFVVRGRARQLVMRFTPINQRLCYIRLRGKFFNFSLINCHAPTEVSPEEDKEAFYEELGRVTESCPKNDVKIILGDFNAQVGKEVALMPTIGTHSLHETSNDNGLRMVNFATLHGLVVGTTLFPRKNIHKATWISPNG